MPKLYSQLNRINHLEIFGMSPYGDDDLIKLLNRMKKITVYVFHKGTNEQTDIWKDKLDELLSSPEIKDSKEI